MYLMGDYKEMLTLALAFPGRTLGEGIIYVGKNHAKSWIYNFIYFGNIFFKGVSGIVEG